MIKAIAAAAFAILVAASGFAQQAQPDFAATKLAAEKNDPEAQRVLGLLYYQGVGTAPNTKEAIRWLTAAVNNGNGMAVWNLGWLYYSDTSGSKDLKAAAACFSNLAAAGHPDSMCQLGIMYENGEGVARSTANAEKCYRPAAEKGLAEAQFRLGLLLDPGDRAVAKGQKFESVEWYRKAADQGHPIARNNLAILYLHGTGVDADAAAAERLFLASAAAGYPEAQRRLGTLYETGAAGAPKNPAAAAQWYEKAAGQGDALAALYLAQLYRDGSGVKKDLAAALRWYQKAAEGGNQEAALAVAKTYREGGAVPKDIPSALAWYRRAAALKSPEAMYVLGTMCFNGIGQAKDSAEGLRWVEAAADAGFLHAQRELAAIYTADEYPLWNGDEIKDAEEYGLLEWEGKDFVDDDKAATYERLAAGQGDDTALYEVGLRYKAGGAFADSKAECIRYLTDSASYGNVLAMTALADIYIEDEIVDFDPVEAQKWYLLAGAYGFDFGAQMAAGMEKSLKPAQIEEAKKRANDWMKNSGPRTPQRRVLVFRSTFYSKGE